MKIERSGIFPSTLVGLLVGLLSLTQLSARQTTSNVLAEADFTVREEMIPMRDGTRLYSWLLPQGALGTTLGAHLDERHEMWNWLMKFPSYGPYWKEVAADQWFESPPRLVPYPSWFEISHFDHSPQT